MKFTDYCKDKLLLLMLHAFCMLLLAAFLIATAYPVVNCCIILFSWFLILAVWFLTEYFRRKRYFAQIGIILEQADTKFLLGELMPRSFRLEDSFYRDFIRRSNKSVIEKIRAVEDSRQEYREYIESWVHEIKTPITAARLTCRHMDSDNRRKFSAELAQIEAHVERVLYYARAESPERDCIIRQTDLADIVSQAVGNHRTLLIQNHMKVETGDLDFTVYTDRKWAVFLLGQLLQNASRYRKIPSQQEDESPNTPEETEAVSSSIRLAAMPCGRRIQLTVSDNGIGIPSHELSRVFDRGFTGSNGRLRGGSTGMGLYLCRRLATLLEIDLQISSEEQKGTSLTLTFPARHTAETLQNCKTNPY